MAGANPKDIEFFARAGRELDLTTATFVAFGSTRRPRGKVDEDDTLQQPLDADTSRRVHRGQELGLPRHRGAPDDARRGGGDDRRLRRFLRGHGRMVLVDMEHFFDGFKADPEFSFRALEAAVVKGATHVVLCDTNGGSLPPEVEDIVRQVHAHVGGDVTIGIHCHDDTGCAVANSMAAVRGGARTCRARSTGSASAPATPTSRRSSPTCSSSRTTCACPKGGSSSSRSCRTGSRDLNRAVNPQAPYVGSSAFAHKAGLHVSAIVPAKDAYEHSTRSWSATAPDSSSRRWRVGPRSR